MRYLSEYIDAVHQRLAHYEHMFLQMVGVEPKHQGKGYASKLIKPMLTRIDKEGLPCYLETFDKDNVPLYEHLGFTVVEKAIIPKTNITNWAMLRETNTILAKVKARRISLEAVYFKEEIDRLRELAQNIE